MTAFPKPVKRARRPSTMPRKLVQLVIERDEGRCLLAGPNCTLVATQADHRSNRGAGGAAVLNHPSVLVGACTACNAFWKENTTGAERAELKRRRLIVPPGSTHRATLARNIATPVQLPDGRWFLLLEDGRREPTEGPREEEDVG